MFGHRSILFLCLAAWVMLLVCAPACAETRIALVIGNARYDAKLGPLANPVKDVHAVATALQKVGFDVDLRTDLDQKSLNRAILRFGERLRAAGGGATGLFYYAGHGLQANGENYMVPVGAAIQAESDAVIEGVSMKGVLAQMENARVGVNIVILDMCRDVPVYHTFMGVNRGLAPVQAPIGSFIAYSTGPGEVAADDSGFATALVAQINTPDVSIDDVFVNVRKAVLGKTARRQTTWTSSSLETKFYFNAGAPVHLEQAELDFWGGIKNSNDPSLFRAYLEKYPNGEFAEVARTKLVTLAAVATPSSSRSVFAPAVQETVTRARTAEQSARQKAIEARSAQTRAQSASALARSAAQCAREAASQAQAHKKGYIVWDGKNDKGKGMHYEGQVKSDGTRDGYGVMSYSDGDNYEGEWHDGGFNGVGVYTFSDGERHEGEWKDDKFNGVGVCIWLDGDRYEGQELDASREGVGVFVGADGYRYEGEYHNDKGNGVGISRLVSGDRYEGEEHDNDRSGVGVYYFKDGRVEIGQEKNGKTNGYAAKLDVNGNVTEQGYYEDDKLVTPLKP